MTLRALLVAVPLLVPAPAVADSPRPASFPCTGELGRVERAICDDPGLSTLDAHLADAWRRATKLTGGGAPGKRLRARQHAWIRRRDQCGTARPCLDRVYRVRLGELQQLGPQDLGEGGLRPLVTWPRTGSKAFGCMLELAGQRDATYHCETEKVPRGDPCSRVKEWTAGPAFPDVLAGVVHPGVDRVELEWEHADLRVVRLHLRDASRAAEVREQTGLPAHGEGLPGNVQLIEVQGDELVLTGFEHMGAGDAECGR